MPPGACQQHESLDITAGMQEPDAELDNFRREWHQEVSARRGGKTTVRAGPRPTALISGPGRPPLARVNAPPPATVGIDTGHFEDRIDDYTPRTFHDLEDKEEHLKLEHEATRGRAFTKEPRSALEHYEQAVEKEEQGSLGDSVALYRKAFKLDEHVQELYKKKHFPQPPKSQQTNDAVAPSTRPTVPTSFIELIDSFSNCAISAVPPADDQDVQPEHGARSIGDLPDEILLEILRRIASQDVSAYARLAQVCKRLAYLIATEDSVWRDVTLSRHAGFGGIHYRYVCTIPGVSIPLSTDTAPPVLDMTPSAYPSYRAQFRQRPRIRFNGCYISTCNYPRSLANTSHYNWTNPVVIVTYYRYLRFFRDGTAISLLTTTAPADVVHHLKHEHVHHHHSGGLPQVVMKDALRARWRQSGAASSLASDEDIAASEGKGVGEYTREPLGELAAGCEEAEGELHIETEGVIPRYLYKMQMKFASAGRKEGSRNNKLEWKGFWSYHKLTGDWSEFGLKNDKAFYFSRVRSYGSGA